MPSLSDDLRECFSTVDLYEILQIDRGSSANEIKRAYYLQSLKVHPDRCQDEDKAESTRKFQSISKIYSILSDQEKRDVYDETGEIDDEDDIFKGEKDWNNYWRILFSKVTVADIQEFEIKYKGSEEELEDIKLAYEECEGDLGSILNKVLCATFEDEERFKQIIQDLIEKGELKHYKRFTDETKASQKKRRKAALKEAKEAEDHAASLGLNTDEDLKALIVSKQKKREKEMDSYLDGLAAKYSKPKSQTKKTKSSSTKKRK